MILITGCGRSGTKYISLVLRELGLDVGHESLGRDGIVSSIFAVRADKYPPYHCSVRPEFDVVLHQVRNPLDTIASLETSLDVSWDFTCPITGVDRNAPILQRSAEHWYHWNLICEEISDWRYRIEDLPSVWSTWCDYVGLRGAKYETVAHISHKTNARRHRRITWDDIKAATPLYAEIRRLAKRYGYG